MQQILGNLCYGLVLLFGIAVSARFSGVEQNRKNIIITSCFFIGELFIQIVCWKLFGLERTKELYPLITHLPLIAFLAVVFKRSLIVSLSSVLAAYLCCQIPKWFALMGDMLFQSKFVYYFSYIPAILICYLFLRKYVTKPVEQLLSRSRKSCLLFGAVPLLYYLFDYATTVYSDYLYSGSAAAVQFIPSVFSMFYFVFTIVYYTEIQKEKSFQRERDLIASQLKQSKTELAALNQMQEQTRQYRHDMRHHFMLLQSLAAKGDLEGIGAYLQTAKSDLSSFTPARYCENETVNLLLSSFEMTAKQAGVAFSVKANLPESLSISDTELCSLLSNSLENAITAARAVSVPEKRAVSVQITEHKRSLLLSVENSYEGDIVLSRGLPQTDRKDHGYGTRSISAIAEMHGGQALFSAGGGEFLLKVMIPLK